MLELCVQRVFTAAELPADKDFKCWLEAVLKDRRQQAVITLRIVDEAESAQLNHQYRDKNQSTNVLSFPAEHELFPGLSVQQLAELEKQLGDLVICAPVVKLEAVEQGKSLYDHWAHLLIHGCLHLLGYDHVTEDQAAVMETIEIKILAGMGIANPYCS
ncbi:MAG: rRNA maturation RNase YbeY [Proteobacteria bacterium]|nr:rRNA maturation RNase YbeY [Pseudomonadota bacterium]